MSPLLSTPGPLADLPIVRLWLSYDAKSSLTIDVPLRIAYPQTDTREQLTGDLIFRGLPLRRHPVPHPSLAVVCLSEATGRRATNLTYTSCRFCHR